MACAENETLLHAYLDGELDLMSTLRFEAHLKECDACAAEHQSAQTLRAAIQSPELYFKAPGGLAGRVRLALEQSEAGTPNRRAPVEAFPRRPETLRPERAPRTRLAWAVGGLAAAAVVVVAAVLGSIVSGRSGDALLAREVLSSHVRSLQASHLADVLSSDQHTVKPWFNGKLDFSPPVKDFTAQGFPLIGGRLDYLAGRPVAAIVYQRRKHVINLFVWPLAGEHALKAQEQQGYHLLRWTEGGMTYWAASDLGWDELKEFVGLVRSQLPPRA